jgi:hypothetical protein
MRSLGPPAGNGTINRIGFAGNSWAAANAGSTRSRENMTAGVPGILIETILLAFPRQEIMIRLKLEQL